MKIKLERERERVYQIPSQKNYKQQRDKKADKARVGVGEYVCVYVSEREG